MKFPWITLLCCAATVPVAWNAGHRTVQIRPPEPTLVMEAPSAPDQLEAPIPAKPPVLPEVLALAAAADLENDSIKRQQQLHAAMRLLADATAAEAKELCLSTIDAFLQEHAIRRWAELEPRAALDHLLGLDAQQISQLPASIDRLRAAVFRGWAHLDPGAALAAAETLRLQRPGYSDVLNAAAFQAVADDVTRGLALSSQFGALGMGSRGERSSRHMWEHQPAAFTRGIFNLPADAMVDDHALRYGIPSAKAWIATDSTGFTAWAVQHFTTGKRKANGFQESHFHAELFGLLLTQDSEAAGRAFAATPPSELRSKMQAQYVAALAAEDPQAAALWLDANITNGHVTAYRLWAEAIAKSAGHEQAAALALALPPGSARDAASEAALYAWAGKDLNTALTWAKAQPMEAGSPAPIVHLCSLWLQREGPKAGLYILQHPELGWSNSDFRLATLRVPVDEAAKLANSLPPAAADAAVKAIAERLTDGSHRVSEIAALAPEQQATAVRLAVGWMKSADKTKAAAWAASIPAGPLRTAGEAALAGTP